MEANPEASPHLQLARYASRLSRAIHRRMDPPLRAHLDLRGREVFVLRAVEVGESNPMAIAERLDIAPSSASRALDRLVERGLIARADDPDDRRKTRLALTARGGEVMDLARGHVVEALQAAYRGVPDEEVEHAVAVLERLVEGIAPEGAASAPAPAVAAPAPAADRAGEGARG